MVMHWLGNCMGVCLNLGRQKISFPFFLPKFYLAWMWKARNPSWQRGSQGGWKTNSWWSL